MDDSERHVLGPQSVVTELLRLRSYDDLTEVMARTRPEGDRERGTCRRRVAQVLESIAHGEHNLEVLLTGLGLRLEFRLVPEGG